MIDPVVPVLGVVLATSAPARVDHLMLGIRDREEGRIFEEQTGVRPAVGGDHPGVGERGGSNP